MRASRDVPKPQRAPFPQSTPITERTGAAERMQRTPTHPPFNTLVKEGNADAVIARIEECRPEVIYSTEQGRKA
jgi:hypothetical protein|nr:hypothetical protein [Paraburkholderia sp. BL8N3]